MTQVKTQLALDLLDPDKALDLVSAAGELVDIIEVGTSLLKLAGIGIVERIRLACPGTPVFVDAKVIDGPEREAGLMERCGADYYSMLAVATDSAVTKVLDRAARHGATVVFDLQSVPDPVRRSRELRALGATTVCVHKNPDCGDDLLAAFNEVLEVRAATGMDVSVAGGINLATIGRIRDEVAPEIVVIGGAILNADDPRQAAAAFTHALRRPQDPTREATA